MTAAQIPPAQVPPAQVPPARSRQPSPPAQVPPAQVPPARSRQPSPASTAAPGPDRQLLWLYGDRAAAAREMSRASHRRPHRDYLAELTMLILWKAQQKDPSAGYARTVLTQLEHVLGTCLDRGIKIVNNAGGLNPQPGPGVRRAGGALGLHPEMPTSRG